MDEWDECVVERTEGESVDQMKAKLEKLEGKIETLEGKLIRAEGKMQHLQNVNDIYRKRFEAITLFEKHFGFMPLKDGKWATTRVQPCPNCGKHPTLQLSKYEEDVWMVICDECWTRCPDTDSPLKAIKSWNAGEQTEISEMIHRPLFEAVRDDEPKGKPCGLARVYFRAGIDSEARTAPETAEEKKKPVRRSKPKKIVGKRKMLAALEGGENHEQEGRRPAGSEQT